MNDDDVEFPEWVNDGLPPVPPSDPDVLTGRDAWWALIAWFGLGVVIGVIVIIVDVIL